MQALIRIAGTAAERRRQGGFTLIELLVVLAILALLVGVVTPQVLKYLARAKVDTARIEVQNLGAALDLYKLDVQRYPTQQEGLQALIEAPSGVADWNGPYLRQKKVPNDPWGHPYVYRVPGTHGEYDLYSHGPDGNADAAGQKPLVANW